MDEADFPRNSSALAAPLPLELPPAGRLELTARDPARNINRRYAIEASIDLFGAHLVETSWGRAGTWGQSRRFAYDSAAEATRAIAGHLRRRARAPRRIGVAYVVVGP
jgi:predicted DNA-binding WGR domain protein